MARATRDKRILVRFITRSCSIQRAISLIGYRRCGRVGERNCSHLINREREKKDDRRAEGAVREVRESGKAGRGGRVFKILGPGGGLFPSPSLARRVGYFSGASFLVRVRVSA